MSNHDSSVITAPIPALPPPGAQAAIEGQRIYWALVWGPKFGLAGKGGTTNRPTEERRRELESVYGHAIILWSQPGTEIEERRLLKAFTLDRLAPPKNGPRPKGWTELVWCSDRILAWLENGFRHAERGDPGYRMECEPQQGRDALIWAYEHRWDNHFPAAA